MIRPDLMEAPTSLYFVLLMQTFVFIFFIIALIYGVNELVLFGVILHAIALIAYLWSRSSFSNVKTEISLNHLKIFPGDPLTINIIAENNKLLPILFKIDIYAPDVITNFVKKHWIHEELFLLSYQHSKINRTFYPSKRGVYRFGAPLLRTGDPFGFFHRYREISDQKEVLVYPKIVPIKPVALMRKEFFKTPKNWSPVDDPILIFGTRDYQPNRSARNINWKTSARFNRLQEKLCEPAAQEKVLIIFDVTSFITEDIHEQFEKSLEIVASLSLALHRQGIPVGLVTNGKMKGNGCHILPISSSDFQMSRILESLARIQMRKLDTITTVISKGFRLPWGTGCVYISNHQTSDLISVQSLLRRRGISLKILLSKLLPIKDDQPPINLRNITVIADLLNHGGRE